MNELIKSILRPPYRIYKRILIALTKEKYNAKVFCIGFNKTGTTSLGKSLELLGYRNSSFNKRVWRKYYHQNQIVKILKYTAKFDSVDDLPWLKEDMIPILDRVFPNSKFIYLTREEKSWKKSYYNWRLDRFQEHADVDKMWEEYLAHERFVLEYFKDFPNDRFISLQIKDKMGFKKLADFLGKETKRKEFPHFNKAK